MKHPEELYLVLRTLLVLLTEVGKVNGLESVLLVVELVADQVDRARRALSQRPDVFIFEESLFDLISAHLRLLHVFHQRLALLDPDWLHQEIHCTHLQTVRCDCVRIIRCHHHNRDCTQTLVLLHKR